MFAESMLETSWAQRSRRSWTTLTSFGLQAFLMGVLLLLPLIMPVGLPLLKPLSAPVSLAEPPGPPPMARAESVPHAAASNLINHMLIAPGRIPITIVRVTEPETPLPSGPIGPYVLGATGTGDPLGVLHSLGTAARPVIPVAPPPAPTPRIRVSQMNPGSLIQRVQPVYPPLAKAGRIQGSVVLLAIISKEGTIENLRVLDGHPMLVKAALAAVSQWRYKPYILNNEPVEVETQVTVNFVLSGS